MHSPKRIKITDVNPHLICVLCGGYYIDATTVIECLHSFCKTCIVRYLEKNKYCPICDVQIHKTSPLLNIRSDKKLQNIVYKLVPSLFKNEMERRVAFYEKNPGVHPVDPEARGEITESCPILISDELLVICLEYQNDKLSEQVPRRYLHCPAALPVAHLIKLIRGKFNLTPAHQVNVFYKDDLLHENTTVMDIAYTYQCRRKTPIVLRYRILELKKTTIRLLEVKAKKEDTPVVDLTEEGNTNGKEQNENEHVYKENSPKEPTSSNSEWKEVQLQISENGVMSVRNMNNSECSPKPAEQAPQSNSQCNTPTPTSHPSASMTPSLIVVPSSSAPNTKPTPSNGPIVSQPSEITTTLVSSNYVTPTPPRVSSEPIVSVSKVTKDQVKREPNHIGMNKLSISRVSSGFKEKGDVLNKIVSKLSPNERVIGNTSVTIRPVLSSDSKPHSLPKTQKTQRSERKPQQTVRYKTLTSPTKQWNPSIDRTTMLSLMQNSDNTKPPRFFKMRNMPRFLGNPSSGVKPMFGGAGEDTSKEPKIRTTGKLPPPYAPGSPKQTNFFSDKAWPSRVPSPAHAGSFFPTNPYHLLYSRFPSPFTTDTSLLAGANPDLIRSMCANTAFHPSLPPSISMLFNPLHNMPRAGIDSNSSLMRIPRSKSPGKLDEPPSLPALPPHPSSLPQILPPPPPPPSSSSSPLPGTKLPPTPLITDSSASPSSPSVSSSPSKSRESPSKVSSPKHRHSPQPTATSQSRPNSTLLPPPTESMECDDPSSSIVNNESVPPSSNNQSEPEHKQ